MEKQSKLKSIYQLLNLPGKRHLKPNQEYLFEKNVPEEKDAMHITPQMQKSRNQLIANIEDQLYIYDDLDYSFKFPNSKFPPVAINENNNISYERKVQYEEEDTFADRLTSEQVDQIRENGEFEVKSSKTNASIPYVWKVNECLLKGRVGRVQTWEEGLAWCYGFMDTAVEFLVETVPNSCKKLAMMPVKFFALIFGRKKLRSVHTTDYNREVYKDFWQDIMKNELSKIEDEMGHEFLKKFYIKHELIIVENIPYDDARRPEQDQKRATYNEKKAEVEKLKGSLKNIEQEFQNNWIKIKKNMLTKVNNTLSEQFNEKSMMVEGDEVPLKSTKQLNLNKNKDETILEKFEQQKYLLYIAHMKEKLPKQLPSPGLLQPLLTLMTIFYLINSKIQKKDKRLSVVNQQIRQKIRKDYSIRSRNYSFLDKTFNKLYEPVRKRIEDDFFDNLLTDQSLGKYFNEKYRLIYTKYVKLIRNFGQLVERKKKQLKCYYQPERTFHSSYILFPPYEVVKQNDYYSLKTQQPKQVDTSTHFWKCLLYGMRFKCWTLNCLKVLIGLCWAGPLGLRCLCGVQDFAYNETVNSVSGKKTEIKRKTLIGTFKSVLDGVYQSRASFQAEPDLGLFGKNCSRICNLIQCYIFRFFLVGVVGVIMLYPIAIILFSTFCIIGILTTWIWVPLAMIVCYLFNILVFQFEVGFSNGGCLIRSVPLVSLVLLVIFHIGMIIASFLFLLIVAPLICFLYFILLVLQRVMRTFTDAIMACLISCLGRTPSRDTAIAKKISGPGMSRSYFYSIAEEDVYILTQASLQRILFNKFATLTREEISKNTQKYNSICKFVFKPFGISRPSLNHNRDFIYTNTNKLLNHFNTLAEHFQRRYPSNPRNVRFTQEQIELYFENCVKIVKNFVEKERIQDWVFDDKGLLYEDYDQLTRHLWIQIFNCGQEIFEPLEKIDSRFKLVDDVGLNSAKMKHSINSVMKALEGEVELSHKRPSLNPAKRSLLEKDKRIDLVADICDTHSSNSGTSITVQLQNPTCLLVAHRNINSLKQCDKYQLEQTLKGVSKVIEQ